MNNGHLTIFYDAGCIVCSHEVETYLKADKNKKLRGIDINSASFDAKTYGLTAEKVRRTFHVLTPHGQMKTGVDAFIEIWDRLPQPIFGWMSRTAKLRGIHFLLAAGYEIFSLVRPYLPRRRRLCEDDICR